MLCNTDLPGVENKRPMGSPPVEFTRKLFAEAFQISWFLFRIMIPIVIVVKVLQELGAVAALGGALSPAMRLVGLPGTMGLVWATTMLTNLYGGVIIFSSLGLGHSVTVAQTTVLAVMMLVAHNLPIELRIAQKAGVRLRYMALLRIGGAFLFGWLLFRIYRWGDWLQGPNTADWLPPAKDPSILIWSLDRVRELAMIFFIILSLLLLMKILTRVGITELMVRVLNPVLRLLGIGPSACTITIVGMTLGIGYGGGMIVQEAVSGRVGRRDVLFSLTLMALCHSIIEDTLVMAVIGSHVSGILWARLLFALTAVFFLVRLISRISEASLERIFVRPPSP